jgi:hypothetical protein
MHLGAGQVTADSRQLPEHELCLGAVRRTVRLVEQRLNCSYGSTDLRVTAQSVRREGAGGVQHDPCAVVEPTDARTRQSVIGGIAGSGLVTRVKQGDSQAEPS